MTNRTLRSISFSFSATNHLTVNGSINAQDALFIVDTGANYTCIDLKIAKQMCLLIKKSEELAGGLGASNLEKYEAIIDRLYIGDILLEAYPIAIIDLNNINEIMLQTNSKAIDGVIGNDILKSFDAILDYSKQELCLKI